MNKNLFLILTTVATLCGCSDDRVNSLEPSQSGSETNGYTMSFSISAEDYDDPDGTRSLMPGYIESSADDIMSFGFLLTAYDTEAGEALFENYLCKIEDGTLSVYDYSLGEEGEPIPGLAWPGDQDVIFYAYYFGSFMQENAMPEWNGETYTLALNNSAYLGYMANDLMACTVTASRSGGPVKLNFKHLFSKFKVVVRGDGNTAGIYVPDFYVTVPKKVIYNFDTGKIESVEDDKETITEYAYINTDMSMGYYQVYDDEETGTILTNVTVSETGTDNYWFYLRPTNDDAIPMTLTFVYRDQVYPKLSMAKKLTVTPAAGVKTYYKVTLSNQPFSTESVDLGLSSGTLWASCNLGATLPSDPGCYYAWGEIRALGQIDSTNVRVNAFNTDDEETLGNYLDNDGSYYVGYQYAATYAKGFYCQGSYKYVDSNHDFIKYLNDGDTILVSSDDAATANLGGNWRMPTADDWRELINNCTWTSTSLNDVSGYQIEGPNGNSIFLPFVGQVQDAEIYGDNTGSYWTSELDVPEEGEETDNSAAKILEITSASQTISQCSRYYGCPVRAVMSSSTPSTE